MKVVLAESAGFCWGVKRAVDKARNLAGNAEIPVFTDGPLIHNQQVMEQLRSEGVVELADPRCVSNGILLVRAHGIPPERRVMLEKLPVTVIDATCPDVARIQGLIKKHAGAGYHVIIFGNAGHPEVVGLLGYAVGRGIVVSRPEEVDNLPDMHPVCLVSQSTQLPLSYGEIAGAVRRRFPSAVVHNTICKSTEKRQQELIEIAETVDAIVVAGSPHSANTGRLVELARTLKPTFPVETSRRLDPGQFRNFRIVGLTAGASTPAFIIEDIRRALERM